MIRSFVVAALSLLLLVLSVVRCSSSSVVVRRSQMKEDPTDGPPDGPPDGPTDGNASAGGGGGAGGRRYHVADFDFAYVATPFVVSLWVIFASAAKIGLHFPLATHCTSYVGLYSARWTGCSKVSCEIN